MVESITNLLSKSIPDTYISKSKEYYDMLRQSGYVFTQPRRDPVPNRKFQQNLDQWLNANSRLLLDVGLNSVESELIVDDAKVQEIPHSDNEVNNVNSKAEEDYQKNK